jgi:hypothetical protein
MALSKAPSDLLLGLPAVLSFLEVKKKIWELFVNNVAYPPNTCILNI